MPGASTDAEIDAVLAELPFRRLLVKRERGRIEVEAKPFRILRLFAEYHVEERKGEKPSSGSLAVAFPSPGTGSVIETIEPVDYTTQNLTAGLQLDTPVAPAQPVYGFSYFEQRQRSPALGEPLYVQRAARLASCTRSRQPLAHSKGDLGFIVPFSGRFTTSVSYSRAEQGRGLTRADGQPGCAVLA